MSVRELTWNELIDIVASNSADPMTVDAVWAEIRRRVSAFFAIFRYRRFPSLSAEDAEDLVQQMLLRLREPRVLNALREAVAPNAYLMRMARNHIIDHFRRRHEDVALEVDVPIPQPEPMVANVIALIRTLKPEEQNLLKMRFYDEMPIGDIAQELKLPYSTVAKRLFRLAQRLREELGGPQRIS